MLDAAQDRRGALVIAHPGHELRVYQWLKLARPLVFVLTDGSGRSGTSRLYQTTRILERAGARRGGIYGDLTDAELYSAVLRFDVGTFLDLTERLADELRREEIAYVVADALEGYNPAHDLCRYVTNAAVRLLAAQGVDLDNFDLIAGDARDQTGPHHGISIDVDLGVLEEKIALALAYTELQADVHRIISGEGIESLKTECFRLNSDSTDTLPAPPFYEMHGRRQVVAGFYAQTIMYEQHIRPIADALRVGLALSA